MDTLNDEQVQPPAPRLRRRWGRGLAIALAVILGLLALHRLVRGPVLRPDTRRLLPSDYMVGNSLNGFGYPAMQMDIMRYYYGGRYYGGLPLRSNKPGNFLLDDRCEPIRTNPVFPSGIQISPQRRFVLYTDYASPPLGSSMYRRPRIHLWALQHGTLRESPLHLGAWAPSLITDAGAIYLLPARQEQKLPSLAKLYGKDGVPPPPEEHYRWMEMPKSTKGYRWTIIPCADERMLVFRRVPLGYTTEHGRMKLVSLPDDNNLYFYDSVTHRMVLSGPFIVKPPASSPATRSSRRRMSVVRVSTAVPLPQMVFHHRGRFLALPMEGLANLYEAGKPARTFGTADTIWHFGEDGTVWSVEDKAYQLLHWQQGTPRLSTIPLKVKGDGRFTDVRVPFLDYYSSPSFRAIEQGTTGVTLWHDGELEARAETVKLMPENIAHLLEQARDIVGEQKIIPREGRRLTLYRQGHRLGSFTIRLKPTPAIPRGRRTAVTYFYGGRPPTPYTEHLAFTHDGKYLSWVIDAGNGPQVYAFKVPKSAWQVW